MSDIITTDRQLNEVAKSIANEITYELEENGGDGYDLAHEHVDSSEHVIYYHRALQICANCDTTQGEEFVEDMGGFPAGKSFAQMACMIAFGEIYQRVLNELNETECA